MSRSDPTPERLRRTGLLTLAGIALFAFLLSRLPRLFAPSFTDYVLRIDLVDGADGLAVGNPVLVAGIPHGSITAVTPIDDSTDRPDVIEVDFNVASSIPMAPNARVTRVTGLGNDGTALSIESLGTPGQTFPTAQRRIVRLAALTPESGLAKTIGRWNAGTVTSIDANLESAADRLSDLSTEIRGRFDDLRAAILELMQDVEPERLVIERNVQELGARLERIRKAWSELTVAFGSVRRDVESSGRVIDDRLDDWQRGWKRIQDHAGVVRADVDAVQAEVERIRSRMQDITTNLDAAIADGRRAIDALMDVAPETRRAMQRTLARMVLAGGQLRMATQNLVPVAVEAILVSPDRRSEERRMLLEAVGDAVLAGLDLEDAMRRTRMLARAQQGVEDPALPVADLVEPLERVVGELDRLLDAIYRRLRMEIAEDLPDR